MFGQNETRKVDHAVRDTLRVQSDFYTIQGEGPLAGIPAYFVRLAGCHLACTFCDTEFDSNYDNIVLVNHIVTKLVNSKLPAKLVVLTGGEPLRQNVFSFCQLAATFGFHIQIETAGNLWVPNLESLCNPWPLPGVSLVVSPKTPHIHPTVQKFASAWKYIIKENQCWPDDGLPHYSTQHDNRNAELGRPPTAVLRDNPSLIYLQPCDEQNAERNYANTQYCLHLAKNFGYRVSLQQHKILDVE